VAILEKAGEPVKTAIAIIVAAVIGAGLGLTAAGSFAQTSTRLAVDVIPLDNTATTYGPINDCAAADVGDEFPVDIITENVTDLLAWEIPVQYDPDVLEPLESDTALFQAVGDGQLLDLSQFSAPGVYTVSAVDVADPPSPATGDGVLATVTFRAIGEGVSPILVGAFEVGEDFPVRGPVLRNLDAEAIGDETGDGVFDGEAQSAEIRVGSSCDDPDARVLAASSNSNWMMILGAAIGGVIALGLAVAGGLYVRRLRSQSQGTLAPPDTA
jgi:hypothetical protein